MMYQIVLLLLCAGASRANADPPPYAQSKDLFSHFKLKLNERLPPENRNFENPDARLNYAFGVLTAVLGFVAKNLAVDKEHYDPLQNMKDMVPQAFEDYNTFATIGNSLLEEAQTRMARLLSLIESDCLISPSIRDCNILVEKAVKQDPDLSKQANLLLKVGVASNKLNELLPLFDSIRQDFEVVPYLVHHLLSEPIKVFIKVLSESYLALLEVRLPTGKM